LGPLKILSQVDEFLLLGLHPILDEIIDPFYSADGFNRIFHGGWSVLWGVLGISDDRTAPGILWDWLPFAVPSADVSQLLAFKASSLGNQIGFFGV